VTALRCLGLQLVRRATEFIAEDGFKRAQVAFLLLTSRRAKSAQTIPLALLVELRTSPSHT
jgi:hypothetical protein